MPVLSVGEAAEALGCHPKLLTDLLYLGRLDGKRCPIFCGRRQIPASYLPTISAYLQSRKREGPVAEAEPA